MSELPKGLVRHYTVKWEQNWCEWWWETTWAAVFTLPDVPGDKLLCPAPLCPGIPAHPLPSGMLEDLNLGGKAVENGRKLMEKK